MNKLILTFFVLGLSISIFAQGDLIKNDARLATQELKALYSLNDAQVAKMQVIQERRFKNYSEIEHLKSEDYKIYLAKKKSVRLGTEASISGLLNKEQIQIFYQQQAEMRKKRSDLIKELNNKGLKKEEIEIALLELEA